jgi:Mg-chelatase subunit ChlD
MNFSDQSGFGIGDPTANAGGYGGNTAFGNRFNTRTGRAMNVTTAARGFYDDNVNTSPDKVVAAEAAVRRSEQVQLPQIASADLYGRESSPTHSEGMNKSLEDLSGHGTHVSGVAIAGRPFTQTDGEQSKRTVPVFRIAPSENKQLAQIEPAKPKPTPGSVSGITFANPSTTFTITNAVLATPQPMVPTNRYAQLSQLTTDVSSDRGDVNRPKLSPSSPVPQPEILTAQNAFSTFSLNVADVSFKLAAASLERGAMPDVANIRSEEFINAFDYRDPQPAPGVPLAFAWERARYPFAHNRDALRFSIKTAAQGRDGGRPLNIVLLLDNSGSMERADRVRIIQESLRTLATQLQAQDKLSVVTFSRTATLRIDGVSGTNAAEVAKQIGALTPEGGTNLEEAMNLAYHTALRHYAATAINRVVLLTDGAANLGNVEPTALKAKVESFRKQGIALDCFGIGWEGLNDDLLEQLSRNGDGRYGFVNTPEEAASEFVGQLAGALRVAASDVKVQVEFNPKRVTAYRQVGYAKHQLTKEQFRDNKVDAAEIGASEAGNGIYIIETNPRGEGPIATVRARFRIPQTSDYREHEWVVPFGSAVELEQSSSAMRLAVSASAFSEWLAGSPFAGEVSTDRLLGILSGVPEVYGADPRPKRLEWMIRQAKSISGK